jgi:hypothetical protein
MTGRNNQNSLCFVFSMPPILASHNIFSYRWLNRRSIVVDGNFSAEHMKMKNAKDDVWLSNGEAYIVEAAKYKKHLEDSIDGKEVSFTID